mmetsp:Transcript_25801/g.61944  ORF Transcript_25801/g.61944 Transcript_25801/m.61944 type:complete len:86 (+) Transcript_25801:148-405(+)
MSDIALGDCACGVWAACIIVGISFSDVLWICQRVLSSRLRFSLGIAAFDTCSDWSENVVNESSTLPRVFTVPRRGQENKETNGTT